MRVAGCKPVGSILARALFMEIWTARGEARDGPVLAAAIHNGHELRPEVRELLALDEATRLREEDPYTDTWAALGDVSLIVHRSRFEMDLNRRLENAVYLESAHAWGLELWRQPPPDELVETSREQYGAFYETARILLDAMAARWHRFAVLDFHSYNHRRGGADSNPEPQAENPDINIGTHDMDLDRWGDVVEPFIAELRGCTVRGRPLDVRCNVKFLGRQFPRWVAANFPGACALAIEVKKIYMDEWTGEPDRQAIGELTGGFRRAAGRLRLVLINERA